MKISIELPDIQLQKRTVYIHKTEQAITQLKNNLDAPVINTASEFDSSTVSNSHLLPQDKGWAPPPPELVKAWFREFQDRFPEYGSEESLAKLLGLGRSRAIRSFRNGETPVPYGVWHRFLVITGRVTQDIIPVLGFFT